MNTQDKLYYTTRDAAKLLGVSVRTIQLWVENDSLQAWKTAGGHRRIRKESVDRLCRQQTEINSGGAKTSIKLLIVEDEQDMLEFYKINIEQWHLPVEVFTARNGYEGLIKIGQHTPDVIIVDLIMPYMDGFELLRVLRNTDGCKNIIPIVATSLSKDEILNRGGIPFNTKVLSKPVVFDELYTLITDAVPLHSTKMN